MRFGRPKRSRKRRKGAWLQKEEEQENMCSMYTYAAVVSLPFPKLHQLFSRNWKYYARSPY